MTTYICRCGLYILSGLCPECHPDGYIPDQASTGDSFKVCKCKPQCICGTTACQCQHQCQC